MPVWFLEYLFQVAKESFSVLSQSSLDLDLFLGEEHFFPTEASNIPFPCNSKPHLVCFAVDGKDLANNNVQARVVCNVNGSNYMADLAW
ncbi:hypothetical protein NC651_030830 [Populus alba x Populus x berolinensis]|nr:hypothetical protein NC651_030830 [Populus alba x Populus x berolinensis]